VLKNLHSSNIKKSSVSCKLVCKSKVILVGKGVRMEIDVMALNAAVKQESQFVDKMMNEVSKVVVGQKEMVEGIMMGLLTGGHVLLEGVPS
jgi:hypothetical protein